MKKINKKGKKTILLAKKVVKKVVLKMPIKAKTKVKSKLIVKPKVNAKLKSITKPKTKVKTKSQLKIASKAKSTASNKTKVKAKIATKIKIPIKINTGDKSKAKKIITKKPVVLVKTKKAAIKKLAVPIKTKKIQPKKPVNKVITDKAKTKKVTKVIKKVDKAIMTPISKPKKSDNLSPVVNKPYSAHTEEEYMNEQQIAHFKKILLEWKENLMESVDSTMHHMQDEAANYPDPVDRASQEEGFSLELRTRDRERKLLKKIDETLLRINEQDYGYCDDCGAQIGIKRLEARPTANQCIECKTIAEIREKQIGEIN